MTCHHSPNDSSCRSHRDYVEPYTAPEPLTPDASNYEIEEIEEVELLLVLKIKYPNCKRCEYEGMKILVVKATMKSALKWRKIDPHFRDTKFLNDKECPSPLARFPGNEQGWKDAMEYAKSKKTIKNH